ncbi:uncharacterized protein LOC109861195, partial [Pseudomyrmex gracilis]|uniref:uncharacterized protein LOC109861195 n=1 Tax=Pseudomyrmex gracilis TaxID=219809 RepID=UPI00099547B7
MIPFSWMTEDKKYAYWPTFTSNDKFRKAVQKCISKMDDWPLHEIKRILATANTYKKGIKKLKKAEFISDVNSESEDNDTLKKSRKYRAKTVLSNEKSFSEEENLVPVPSYPKVPQNTNLNKQLFKNPAFKMPFKNKHVSKQIDYEDDNRSLSE